jgi:sterol desaturase/sphingolipid hydroxylase (fatty acid hydroxylase superfamily)
MLAHRVPLLWELHKVHHSAEVLTPFTVYRTHPIESILMRGGAAVGVGAVAGLMSFCFRGPISGWQILGVDAIGILWNALGANLRHSHVWLSYGRILEHVLISPAQHQIHHSDQRRHFHKNFGSTLAIWDWIGRSLYVTRGREHLRFGLPPEEQNHRPTVMSAWFAPIAAIGSRRWRRREHASTEPLEDRWFSQKSDWFL